MLSSIAVVAIGLIPTLIGGPVFALVLLMLGIVGFREYLDLAVRPGGSESAKTAGVGVLSITTFAITAFFGGPSILLFGSVIFALAAPLFVTIISIHGSSFLTSSLVSVGSLYVGLPIFAAILLRATPGPVASVWLVDLAQRLSLGWTPYPRGLAWAAIVVVATWLADTVAYLAGSRIGGRKLAPRLSPNKTVAGAVAGLASAAIAGAIGFSLFALGNPWLGIVAGILLGIAGQSGDLAESFLKRQAGVKDSGALIPGHGGLLDRIDALLFAFPAGLLIVAGFDWLQMR